MAMQRVFVVHVKLKSESRLHYAESKRDAVNLCCPELGDYIVEVVYGENRRLFSEV